MTKKMRDIVQIDEELCDGCGLCVPGCAEGAIVIQDGKARLVAEMYCDGLGACLGQCPRDAITIIQREADAFDEEAVEERLHALKLEDQARAEPFRPEPGRPTLEDTTQGPPQNTLQSALGCGCPGTAMASFAPDMRQAGSASPRDAAAGSSLGQWPVKIRLIPPHAPFLRGADLLVTADCAAGACPNLHRDFLPGRVLMLGCPKFDDVQEATRRFEEIFQQAGINSVTVLSMEVPCCAGLAHIVRQALRTSGQPIPFREVILSRQGRITNQVR
jgi:Pyruvate/2-oxoacid:ferredoxin oxidoreductase delta subunit